MDAVITLSAGWTGKWSQQSHCQVQFYFNFRLDTAPQLLQPKTAISKNSIVFFWCCWWFCVSFSRISCHFLLLSFYSAFLYEIWWANIIRSLVRSFFFRYFLLSCCYCSGGCNLFGALCFLFFCTTEEMSCVDLNKVHFGHINVKGKAEKTFEAVNIWDSACVPHFVVHIVILIMSDFTIMLRILFLYINESLFFVFQK